VELQESELSIEIRKWKFTIRQSYSQSLVVNC
jgi:hypothetical protein